MRTKRAGAHEKHRTHTIGRVRVERVDVLRWSLARIDGSLHPAGIENANMRSASMRA
jgi:hypothetical protein